MNFSEALAAMDADPDTIATLHADELHAGFRKRVKIRAALELAEENGATVEWVEDCGLLLSVFSFRLRGFGHELREPVRQLLEIADGAL